MQQCINPRCPGHKDFKLTVDDSCPSCNEPLTSTHTVNINKDGLTRMKLMHDEYPWDLDLHDGRGK